MKIHSASFSNGRISPPASKLRNSSTNTVWLIDCNMQAFESVSNGANIVRWSDGFAAQTFNIDAEAGAFQSQQHGITPRTDGAIFNLRNAASTPMLLATSNATAASATLDVDNGAKLRGFSDTGATLKWSLDAATGVFKQATTVVGSLPSAVTVGAGAHHFVTDATATTTAGVGAIVTGNSANFVPVYSDGTNWRIG